MTAVTSRLRALTPGRRLAVAGIAAVLAVGAGVALGEGAAPGLIPEQVAAPARTAFPPDAPGLTLPYRDPEAGIGLSYPASWQRLDPDAKDVDLLAVDGKGASLLMRTTGLPSAVEPGDLDAARDLLQPKLSGVDGVELLAPATRTTLGGLEGWWYLYAFEDQGSGRRGIHSHYFLFDGDRMITLVFQATPAQRFRALAPVFDQIAGSFRQRSASSDDTR